MIPLDQGLSQEGLADLERLLASPGTSMDVHGMDGYFAALATCPRMVVPSDWLPWIWDSDRGEVEPEFESAREAQHLIGLVMRQFNSVVAPLSSAKGRFVPLYGRRDAAAAKA